MDVGWSDVANLLTASGIGAIVGGVVNSLVQVWGKRGSERANIAEKLTGSADKWITRVEAENDELQHDLREMRHHMNVIGMALDKLRRQCNGDHPLCEGLDDTSEYVRRVLFHFDEKDGKL